MSEVVRNIPTRNRFEIGNSRSTEWSNLRLMVYRDRTPYLTVALVEQAKNGHPHLDSRIRGLQVAWDPSLCSGDLRTFALQQALLGVTQTRR